MEAWGSRGSPQPQPARKVPLSVNPLGGHRKTCQRFRRPQGWVTSGQTTNREGVQPHPSADNWIKALLSKALPCRARPCPAEQDPVFPTTSPSHLESYTSLLASSIRGQTEAARAMIPQWLKEKPYYRRLIRMKSKVMSQRKGQYKTPEKQTK